MTASFRKRAPTPARAFTFFALVNVAMGLNFLLLNPAFDPFDIPKDVSGVVFLVAGLAQLAILQFSRSLRIQRVAMLVGASVMSLWGGILFAATFVEEATSLQLPIAILGLAYLGLVFLYTPQVEP